MATLAEAKHKGRYIISEIKGSKALTRRLTELGMLRGKVITVLATSSSNSGLLIYFQGQRLAVSEQMGACIKILDVDSLEEQDLISLDEVALKKTCVVAKITGSKELRRRLMDMGLTKNTLVTVKQVAPLGDPLELILRGYKLSLRKQEAHNILVKEAEV